MMFARKSKVETVPMYGPSHGYENQYYPRDEYDDRYYGSNRNINDDYDYDDHNQYNDYDEDYVESPPKTKNLNVVHVKNLITMMISIVIIEITTTMKQRFKDEEQDLATDTEEDKYNQYPKRAITGEYQSDAMMLKQREYF